MRRLHLRVILFAAIALSVGRGAAHADVLYTYGYTPRGIGMGGAMTAVADDMGAAYYNPAGAAFQTKPLIGLGYLYTGSEMKGIGVRAPSLATTYGVLFGTILPIPFGGFLTDRVAFGLASFFPNGLLLGIEVPYATSPQYVLLQNSGRSLSFIPTFSIKLLDILSIGGGVQTFDNTSGSWHARINQDGSIQATVTQEMIGSYAATAGLMFRPGAYWSEVDGLRFGFVFRDSFFTSYKIPVATSVGGVPLVVEFNATSLYTPRQYVAGLSYATGNWLFAVDGSYNEWSEFPHPSLDVSVHFKIPVLPIAFRDSVAEAPHFHDTVTVKTGAEVTAWRGNDGVFMTRFGLGYDPSPVPPQRGNTNFLDTDRWIGGVSVGWRWLGVGTYKFSAPLVFDLGGQLQYLPARVTEKADTVDPTNPGYPRVGFQGWLYAVGGTLSIPFDYE